MQISAAGFACAYTTTVAPVAKPTPARATTDKKIHCSACGASFDTFSLLLGHVREQRGKDEKHPMRDNIYL